VQEPAAVRDLLLLLGQRVDALLQVVVGERGEIGQRFKRDGLSSGEGADSKAVSRRRVNLSLRF
jgi:hypothetical protein